MGNNKVFRFRLPTVCIKLGTLRDSCSSILKTQTYPPSFTWFGGAAAICQEAIDYIKPMRLDTFVVMSQPALDKYKGSVDAERTVVIADSTLIKETPQQFQSGISLSWMSRTSHIVSTEVM